MRRAVADVPEEDDAAEHAPAKNRRAALQEFENLGALYATLNYLAPLVRLWSIGTFLMADGHAYRQLLGLEMAAIAMGASRPALFRLSSQLAGSPGSAEDESSSRFHQLRVVWSQGLRCALFVVVYAVAVVVYDPRPFLGGALGGHEAEGGGAANHSAADGGAAGGGAAGGGAASAYSASQLAGLGVALFAAWSVVWSLVQARAPRERLAMADGTHDLTSASEDELLRAMPPALRLGSLAFRVGSVGFETPADVLLLLVFLPSRLEGLPTPSARRAGAPPLALLAAALVYGSQHLRFRGEWLLCGLFGLALGGVAHALHGELLPSLVAATLFAVFRHARRTGLDVRRFHAQ